MVVLDNHKYVEKVACPTCGSEVGKPCVKLTRRGERTVLPTRRPHPDRVLQSIDKGYLPMGAVVEEE